MTKTTSHDDRNWGEIMIFDRNPTSGSASTSSSLARSWLSVPELLVYSGGQPPSQWVWVKGPNQHLAMWAKSGTWTQATFPGYLSGLWLEGPGT
ncbi:hypothetical protein TIFTF001_026130 [Ficus carica]|uniref:Uncharacterized protein n=1 Tax=Ficus carica TaxID=3494 RepID=A0AA88AXQ9_FICCA|nr:hypothetical protein TIFTF001_026130 [Ficus carica]